MSGTGRRVLVLGGGVIGVCSAYYLAREGFSVTLVERDEIGAGCSFGNAGLIVPSQAVPLAAPGVWQQGLRWLLRRDSPFRVRPRWDGRLLRWLWRFFRASTHAHVERALPVLRDLGRASQRLYEELAALPGLEFGYRRSGLLLAYRTPPGFAEGLAEARLLSDAGVTVRVLDAEALGAAEPWLRYGLAGGIFFPDDAQLVPDRFVASLAEQARRDGATLLAGREVVGFETRSGRIAAVLTRQGRLDASAAEVVLAAGAWSAKLARPLGVDLALEAGKGYSLTLDPPPSQPLTPLILVEDHGAVTPMDGALRLSGTLELAGLDLSIDERRARSIVGNVAGWARDWPERLDAPGFWAGLRPCTPDGLPCVGRVAGYENLIVATGHAMLGVSLAPISGRLVADLASHRDPGLPIAALDPARFGRRSRAQPRKPGAAPGSA